MFDVLEVLASVDSTNDFIRRYVDERVPRLVVASAQTAGRGRLGRTWHSPPGEGLYVSYLFFPGWDSSRVDLLNAVVSLAALSAVKRAAGGLAVRLKAPNDLYVERRKLGGILVESSIAGRRLQWVIAGIGINVGQERFPPELEGRATSLRLEGAAGCDPLDLCAGLTRTLEHYIEIADAGLWSRLQQEYEKAER